jgi:flagellar biosynthesis protein FlhF
VNIKRFVAQDMRQAIRMVRETLGPDAVILSNKSVPEGVELMAALDLDSTTDRGEAKSRLDAPRSENVPGAADRYQQIQPQQLIKQRVSSTRSSEKAAVESTVSNLSVESPASEESLGAIRREMAELRHLLQNELNELTWRDLGEHRPERHEILRRLMGLGLSGALARQLSDQVEHITEIEQAWQKALKLLAGQLPMADDELIDRGGVVALVGPTGVGKTTTIAKLAARFALRHGNRRVGLITIDNFRIGARDQLHTYGRILNVPVRNAASAEELDNLLVAMADRDLVLIDTAGMGAPGERFDEQAEILRASTHQITRLLALSATTGAAALQRAQRLFDELAPDACVLTKLDEAACLGGVLSALVEAQLPLTFITDGQRVPEDLQIARAPALVSQAAELMETDVIEHDPAYYAFSFGGNRLHAHV